MNLSNGKQILQRQDLSLFNHSLSKRILKLSNEPINDNNTHTVILDDNDE